MATAMDKLKGLSSLKSLPNKSSQKKKSIKTTRPTLDPNALVSQGVFDSVEPVTAPPKTTLKEQLIRPLQAFDAGTKQGIVPSLINRGLGKIDEARGVPLAPKPEFDPKGLENIPYFAGRVVGDIPSILAAYYTGGAGALGALSRVAPVAPRLLANPFTQQTVKGLGAGAVHGTMRSAVEGQPIEEAVKTVGTEAALFGGGELMFKGVATGINKLLRRGSTSKTEKEVFDTGVDIGQEIKSSRLLPPGISPASLKLPSTIETITSKTDKESLLKRFAPANVANKIKTLYYKTVDGRNRLNDVDKLYAKNTGRNLSANERTFILAHNTSNAETIAEHVLTKGLVDSKGNTIGVPLMEIVKRVPKGEWRNFEDYLKLKHFKSWEAQGM